MVFDSITFFFFFALFICPYLLLWKRWRWQNAWLLAASAVFYGWWDWRFLGLMFGTSFVDYVAGRMMGAAPNGRRRKLVLAVSVGLNLSTLLVFKYYNFFADALVGLLGHAGVAVSAPTLRVLLPVGISFYTFQSISYAVDVFRREIEPERNVISYFTFVCCFPHLVAGPIQRASHLLHQLNRPRVITAEHAREAVWLLAWGFFQKQVISNSAAAFVGMAFRQDAVSGWTTILGTFAFALQIYCDFNAYSLIARGTGRLIGLEFTWNFNQPYFATSIRDFWRRWHMSLSNWLRDYLYVPLGGSRHGALKTYRNLFLTMLLGGLWHGASWTFVLWGALHGLALCVHRLYSEARRGRELPDPIGWLMTMTVVLVGWFLFRCESYAMASSMAGSLAHMGWSTQNARIARSLVMLATPIAAVELWQFRAADLGVPWKIRYPRFAVVTGAIFIVTASMFNRMLYEFIYFQF